RISSGESCDEPALTPERTRDAHRHSRDDHQRHCRTLASGSLADDQHRCDDRRELGSPVREDGALDLLAGLGGRGHVIATRTKAMAATTIRVPAPTGTNLDGGNGSPRRMARWTARQRRYAPAASTALAAIANSASNVRPPLTSNGST